VFTPPFSLAFLILSAAFIGLAVGVVIGPSVCLLLRLKIRFRNVVVDGFLGSLGFSAGWFATFFIPWPNTVTYYVDQKLVTSTMSHFQHPDVVAYVLAVLLPVFYEFRRFKNPHHQLSSSQFLAQPK
jgi:hypothetical protein